MRAPGAGRGAWSLLVNGVNLQVGEADRLLRSFDFIPQARLDDVMISYAVPGGGVGPHFDSYDVFLVQGAGRRLWRLERKRKFRTVEGAPLRLIADFSADEEYLLEPGDLLYLPPGWGHEGIAIEPCITCSVGFRAPGGAELGAAFLDYLQERGLPDGRYRDPSLRPTARSARIGPGMLRQAGAMLARIRWSRRDVDEFLGEYLSAPKPGVFFEPPAQPLPRRAFERALARSDVALDLKTILLHAGARFFLNGEGLSAAPRQRARLGALADRRRARGAGLAAAGLTDLLYQWYRLGYLHLESAG
jgi:50S ribosomal protein L16 3-hydroxylase